MYRLLEDGEVVNVGDEGYLNMKKWERVSNDMNERKPPFTYNEKLHGLIRRKVSQENNFTTLLHPHPELEYENGVSETNHRIVDEADVQTCLAELKYLRNEVEKHRNSQDKKNNSAELKKKIKIALLDYTNMYATSDETISKILNSFNQKE